jgi:hypothetical protein
MKQIEEVRESPGGAFHGPAGGREAIRREGTHGSDIAAEKARKKQGHNAQGRRRRNVPSLGAANDDHSVTEISLRMPRRMGQWHEPLAAPLVGFKHVVLQIV